VTVAINALVLVTLLRVGGSSLVCDLGVTDVLRFFGVYLGYPQDCCCALYGSWGSVLLG
jgi:hypothetical protein